MWYSLKHTPCPSCKEFSLVHKNWFEAKRTWESLIVICESCKTEYKRPEVDYAAIVNEVPDIEVFPKSIPSKFLIKR